MLKMLFVTMLFVLYAPLQGAADKAPHALTNAVCRVEQRNQYLARGFDALVSGEISLARVCFEAALPFCIGSSWHVEFNVRHQLNDCFRRDNTLSEWERALRIQLNNARIAFLQELHDDEAELQFADF